MIMLWKIVSFVTQDGTNQCRSTQPKSGALKQYVPMRTRKYNYGNGLATLVLVEPLQSSSDIIQKNY